MAVQEGEDATLTCRATGNPTPRVTWKKEDGDFIYVRKHGNRDLMKGLCSWVMGMGGMLLVGVVLR